MSHRNFRLPIALIGLVFLTAVAASPASASSRDRDFNRGHNHYQHRSDGWYDGHGHFHRYERHHRS